MDSSRWEIVDDLSGIEMYLDKHLMDLNHFRVAVGDGRSVTFGCVAKRNGGYGESRQGWRHPELYQMLLDFAAKYVTVQWDGIQVNQNYPCNPHRDLNNQGTSFIVAMGNYKGGELCVENEGDPGHHDVMNIHYSPKLFNGSKRTHWTKPWTGTRYSIVFFANNYRPGFFVDMTEHKPYFDGVKWWLVRKNLDGSWTKLDKRGHEMENLDMV